LKKSEVVLKKEYIVSITWRDKGEDLKYLCTRCKPMTLSIFVIIY